MKEDAIILPVIESLEPRLFLSGDTLESVLGDFGNTLSTAEEVTIQADGTTVVSGEISSKTDYDFIKFTSTVTGGLQVTMDGSGSLNSYLQVYNSNLRRIAANDNVSRGNPDAGLQMFVQAGETYYLNARSVLGTTGQYDLSLLFSEDVVGSTYAAATELTVVGDSTTVQESTINYYRDRDMFTFTASATGGLTVSMLAQDSSIDSYLMIYNSAGRRIAANNNISRYNKDSEVSFRVQEGETYYVCAQALGRVTGDYRLELELNVDDDAGSRSSATSVALAADETVTLTSGIEYLRDTDFFTFVAAGNGGVTVTMAGDASGVNSYLMVYDASGRRIAANNNYHRGSGDARVSFFVQSGQTYYLCANAVGRSLGEYDLTVRHQLDEYANSAGNAEDVVVTAGQTTTVEGGIEYANDVDYFQFTASDTGGMTIRMNAADGSPLDCMLYVRDTSGRYIAYNDDIAPYQTNSRVNFYVQAGQTYFVMARGWRTSQGDYNLLFDLDVDEVGNNAAGAQSVDLDANGNATVTGTLEYSYDVDCFTFTADQSTSMTIRMRDVDASIRPYLAIWNSQGQRLSYTVGNYGGTTALNLNVSAGEQYYVQAASLSKGQGQYTIDFDMVVDDHSNDRAGATQLDVTAGVQTTTSGVIDYAYDRDFFTFTAAETGGMIVTQNAAAGSLLDSYLTIRNASGSVITYNDDSNGTLNSTVSFYVQAGSTYYVQAHAYGTSQGAYELSLLLSVDEFGGSLATAGEMTLDDNGVGTITGAIQFGGDNDYVAFFATHTADMTLSLSRTSGTVQPRLAIYNSSGQLLTTGAGTSSVPASATFSATEGAKYYARVYSASTSDTGNYRLSAQTDIPIPDPEPNPDLPTPTPGAVVTATVYDTGSGLVLRILGTNNNDTIVVSQTANSISITGSYSCTYNNTVSSIEIYGFGGDDVLRTAYSVTCSALIYGGAGADTIYSNSQGQSACYGQDGDDLIVTVGGGHDSATGGEGTDSFWADSTDSIVDSSAAETSARSVHIIGGFYQPYTSNTSSSDYVSLEIAGQNFRDPTLTSSSYHYANFSNYAVFNNGPQYDDITQGALGDCYFLASASSLAQTDPSIIRQMVTALGDGTYAVRYYDGANEVYLRIDGDLPVNSSNNLVYARTSDTSEIWVPLIEKAYAHFRYGQDTYASIEGGWMDTVYEEITGVAASFRYTSGTTSSLASYIRDNLAAGHAVTLGSYSGASSPVVGSHAYQVVSIDANNYVTVYNPWGVDGRSYDSNYYDGLLRLSITQIQSNYVAVCVSGA